MNIFHQPLSKAADEASKYEAKLERCRRIMDKTEEIEAEIQNWERERFLNMCKTKVTAAGEKDESKKKNTSMGCHNIV